MINRHFHKEALPEALPLTMSTEHLLLTALLIVVILSERSKPNITMVSPAHANDIFHLICTLGVICGMISIMLFSLQGDGPCVKYLLYIQSGGFMWVAVDLRKVEPQSMSALCFCWGILYLSVANVLIS